MYILILLCSEQPVNTLSDTGTIITLYKPFYDLPVRRQLAIKQASNTMKKIQELLYKYALVHSNIRFSSQQTKDNKWIKPITSSIESSMSILFGTSLTDMMEHFLETDLDHPTLSVDVILPKSNSDPSITLKGGPDRIYIYVNDRPINYIKSELKELVHTIRMRYRDTIGLNENTSKKIPFIYINIKLSPHEYDVNIEPNKTTILFHQKQLIYNLIHTKILDKIYPLKVDAFFQKTSKEDSHIEEQGNSFGTTPIEEDSFGKDWSFNMEEDELESDDSQECMKTADQNTVLTKQMTPIIIPLQNNVSNPITPKKRTLEEVDSQPKKNTLSKPMIVERTLEAEEPLFIDTQPKKNMVIPKPMIVDKPSKSYTPRQNNNNNNSNNNTQPHYVQTVISVPAKPNNNIAKTPVFKSPVFTKQIKDTLNQTMTIDCNIQDIKATYTQRKEVLSETYRISIDEYLNANSYDHPGQITSLIKFPLGNNDHLSFYTRGIPSTVDKHRHQIYQLGVVKSKSLAVHATLQRLIKEHTLVCKKSLERPVQIKMDHDDHLCPILISLKSKEQFVHDDLHGQQKITYSEITEETIVNNGFKVRWRKDLYSGDLVIQFTAIYSLSTTGYGPFDFRELLGLMMKSKPGQSFIRPMKVMDYLKSLAEQMQYQPSNIEDHVLADTLNGLLWKKDKGDWQIGYGTHNKVLACMLASSSD